MSSLGSPNPFFIAGKKAYEVERSLRFDNVQIPLKRTPSSSSNKKTMTFSLWFKRAVDTNFNSFFIAYGNASNRHGLDFISGGQLRLWGNYNGSVAMTVQPTQVFRDFSAWYHFVCAIDTTQGTASNRVKMYVNGTQITDFATASYPSQNFEFAFNDQNAETQMGSYSKLYLAEIHEIDGFAYDPSYFGETDPITGQWNPKKYTGSYGTNGFYLNFSDNSSTSALGTDSSGNSNNFTVTNLSVSAGEGNDSLEDTPTNNWCTWNPLSKDGGTTLSNGNLDISSANYGNNTATFFVTSGKWYWEGVGTGYVGAICGNDGQNFANSISGTGSNSIGYWNGNGYAYWGSGSTGSGTTYSSSDVVGIALDMDNGTVKFYKNNTLIHDLTFGSGTIPDLSAGVFPCYNNGLVNTTQTVVHNFGQRAFSYTPPTGFKALNSKNLPTPSILLPNKHFDTLLWTGNATSRSITGLNFQPDWVWIKNRSNAYHHGLFDAVRGANKVLKSSDTSAEGTFTQQLMSFNSDGYTLGDNSDSGNYVNINGHTYVGWNWNAGNTDGKTYTVTVVDDSGNKFRFDGFGTSAVTLDLAEGGTYIFNYPSGHPFRFSTTSDGTHGGGSEYTTGVTHNSSTQVTIVVAASAPTLYYYCSSHSGMGGQVNTNSTLGSSNFDGSIQSTVKVNATAGFSIVSYAGNQSSAYTIGHGLGVAPNIIIAKSRTDAVNWGVYYSILGTNTNYMTLNTTDAQGANNNSEMSGVYAVLNSSTVQMSYTAFGDVGSSLIMYAFSEVAGYSKFGSYTGNGNNDGPFVFTGFTPKWILLKCAGSTGNWVLIDTERPSGGNFINYNTLSPNLSSAENSSGGTTNDILSNGFKMRGGTDRNISGQLHIYLAFAESPFKNARAR